ncbi:DegT/DnrJ/EryC1/StrS aminotransferase family protein [Micromonospora sp. RP3T]|uniref:DegT/DnrJ/EryC1/StrS family aminotransferase n=1 Tax=Micromonospora sp. RP3T TaxID=2135446 RepID=UPI000D160FF8|nr:DegT/DnrJ/EryC1/StrS family aminotransferase [Micromonospora sp. RP3T]PTA46526.1 glutamine--scyllo-inositol aminotransferase [Micromonospora sp. RP3T]
MSPAPSDLAMLGGAPAVPRGLPAPRWPVVTDADEAAVLDVLRDGALTSVGRGDNEVARLEREWAAYCGVGHAVATSNGTTALALALAALGVGPGDEVVVPALSFVASALAPTHVGAVPVFADIDPEHYLVDPAAVRAAVTPRTAAIMPVHLHGLPADMAELTAVAGGHGLAVVEDAAQAHGARYRDTPVGGLGDLGVFSLNASKNLPTCGEGGLITTDRPELGRRALLLRQFGEDLNTDERAYVSATAGFNAKLSAVQAAFTRSQLARFEATAAGRERAVRRFLDRLGALPGLVPPRALADRTHAWHLLRFRIDPAAAGLDVPAPRLRAALQRALRAEGVPVGPYQVAPLPAQPLFADGGGWRPAFPPVPVLDPAATPVAARTIEETFVLQKVHLDPGNDGLLDRYATAAEKVWEHLTVLAEYADRMEYRPPWARPAGRRVRPVAEGAR